MAREKALEYIQQVLKSGFSEEDARQGLKAAGWPDSEINLAMVESHLNNGQAAPSAPPALTPAKVVPKQEADSVPLPTFRPFEVPLKPVVTIIDESASVPEVVHEAPLPAKITAVPRITKPISPPPPVEQIRSPRLQPVGNELENLQRNPTRPTTQPKPSFVPEPPRARMRSIPTTVIAGALLLVIVSSAGASGYWYYKTHMYPQTVLASALETLSQAKSYRYDLSIEASSRQPASALKSFVPPLASIFLSLAKDQKPSERSDTFIAHFQGAADFHDPAQPKQRTVMTFGLYGKNEQNLSLETRYVNNVYYFQLTRFPDLDTLGVPLLPIHPQSFTGTWVSFDPKAAEEILKEHSEELSALSGTALDSTPSLDTSSDEFTQKQIDEFLNIWRKGSFVAWSPAAKKSDDVYEFTGRIKKEGFNDFFEELSKTFPKQITPESVAMAQDFIGSLDRADLTVFVSNKTRELQGGNLAVIMKDAEVHMKFELSDFNTPLTLEAPSDAKDFATVLNQAFGVLESQARDSARVRDISKLQEKLHTFREETGAYPKSLDTLVPEYIALMPKDPVTKKVYMYRRTSQTSYVLSAQLETLDHPLLKLDDNPENTTYDVIGK